MRLSPELRASVLHRTQRYRITFDTKQERSDYYEYYYHCQDILGPAVPPCDRTILSLLMLGWSRRKTMARAHPAITEYRIRMVYRKYNALVKVKAMMKAHHAQYHLDRADALLHVNRALDANGDIARYPEP